MLETPHVALGAAIATKIPNPLIAIPLAFASHFIIEKVPHWNPHLNRETEKYGRPTNKSIAIIAIDVVVSLILGTYLASRVLPDTNHALTIFFASFASVLPDLLEAPYFFLKRREKILVQWIKMHKSLQVDADVIPGLLTQLITVIATLFWIS